MKNWKYIVLLFLAVGLWAPLNGQIAQVMDDFLHATGATETDPDPLPWAQTWNDGSDTFVGFQMDITDTASAAGSLLMDLQVGSTTLFSVGKTGIINTAVGLDGIGAVDLDYGSADVTDHTFITDGTGNGEIVLPDDSIGADEILDDAIVATHMGDADHGQVAWSSGVASVQGHTRFIEKHGTTHTLTAAECYGAVYYITASGVTLTLPAAADGMSIRVICTTANVGIIDANASDLIILDGTALDDGDSIDSAGAAGDVVDLHYYDSTGWFAVSISGTWVDGGAS